MDQLNFYEKNVFQIYLWQDNILYNLIILDYNNKIAYVQQNDILLAVFTPEEALTFSADIRLNISKEDKREKVENIVLLNSLWNIFHLFIFLFLNIYFLFDSKYNN